MKTKIIGKKLLSCILAIAILLGVMPITGLISMAAGTTGTVADPATIDGWRDWFPENSSRYAGGVFVDKSVFTSEDARDYFANDIADKLSFSRDNFGNENFLVALSGIGSNTEIKGYSSIPTDTMLALDLSNSMSDNEIDEMVTSANRAIQRLLELNNYNRVGVVLYSGNSSAGNSSASTGTVILPLGRYTTEITETVSGETYNVYLSSNNNSVSVARQQRYGSTTAGVKAEGSDEYITGSKSKSGATYMQNGIYLAYEQFEAAPDKVIPEGQVQAGTKRVPILVLMGDGAPTAGTTSYNDVATSNTGNGTSENSRISFLTQLTAAWTKAKVASLYNIPLDNVKLYTLGLGVSTNQNAADVLNPMNAQSNTSTMWSNFINNAANNNGNVTVANNFSVPKDTTGMLTSTDQRNYVTRYWNADDAADMVAAFEQIVSEIINQSKTLQDRYYSTLVDGNAETDGYISFTDEIGTFMEVKDMKGIHIGEGSLVTGGMFAEYMLNGQFETSDGVLTELGTELIEALMSRLNVTADQAYAVIDNAIANGYISFTDADNFSNYVAWYADENNGYIAPYNELARASAPENAKYIMKSYLYLGDVTMNYAETSMMYTFIRVKEDIVTGRQSVDANLPAALLPMITYTIEIEGEELTEDSIIGMTSNADEKTPATLLYEVGLRDDITPYNITEIVTDDFRKNDDGTYTFYSNRWRSDNGGAFTIPETVPESIFNHGILNTTVTQFTPSFENTRYYYTEDTLIYEKNGDSYTPYTGDTAPTGDGYYHQYSYAVIENGEAKLETVYNPITANAISNNKQDGENWYVKANTPKNYFNYLGEGITDDNAHSVKSENVTETLTWSKYPTVVYHASEGHNGYHVVNYLGNNGKLTVAAAQGIKLTKAVSETVEGASNSFTFNIALSGTVLASSYPYRLEKADGTVEEGTVAVVNNSIQRAIGAGDVLYITGLPTGTQYTVTEQYNAYYVASSSNATGTVAEYTINAVDFVNSPRGYGSLLVEKDVTHPFGTTVVPDALINKEFDITVTFSGNANDLANIVAPDVATKVSDSVYTLKLSDGEDVLFTNIPETVSYVVTENLVNANKGDKDYGFTLTTEAEALQGTIVKDTESMALLVNDYDPDSVTPDITLTGTKDIPNYDDTATEYQIALQQVAIGGDTTVNIDEPVIIDAIKEGETYSYNMGSAITYTEVGTYSYMVYEVEPADGTAGKPANIAYDKSFALFSIAVTDNDADGVLEIDEDNIVIHRQSAEFDISAQTTTIVKDFENLYEAGTVSFDMQKTINNSSEDHAYDSGILFGVFADPTETTSRHNPLYYALTDDNGKATISFNILKADYATAKYYYVREIPPLLGDRVVGMTYDNAFKYVVEVVWTGAEPEVKYYNYDADADNDYGLGTEIASTANKPDSPLVINNNYDDTVVSTPRISLGGEKTINGREWKQGDEFTFELYITDADFSTTGLTPAQSVKTTDGNIQFDDVTFGTSGTKYMVIKEAKGNAGGITYAETVYHITVNVVKAIDENGKTILSVSENDGGSVVVHKVGVGDVTESDIDFENTYTITDTEKVKIYGTKALTGRTLVAGEFKFELYEAGNNQPLYTVANTAAGTFNFPEFTYTAVGEHTYTVKEYIPTDKYGVAYDTKAHTVTVTLTDDGNGGLAKTVKLNGNTVSATVDLGGIEATRVDVAFANSYSATGTQLTLSGIKTLEGRRLTENDKFTFELYEANSSFIIEADAEPIKTAQNDKDTDYTGSYEITLNYADGQEGTYYYVLSEKIPESDKKGIGYDTRDYLITVMVIDDGNGQLSANVIDIWAAGIPGDFTSSTLNFGNAYMAAPAQYTVSGEKAYNKTLNADMFSFVLSYNGEAVETVKNKADGRFEFAPVELTTAGTHTLTVKEENGGSTIKGIKYDSTVYTIVITVEDNGEGQLVITEELVNGSANTDVKFNNTYSADATDAIKISGNKKLDANGRAIEADEFSFELYEADKDYKKQGNAIKTAKNNANGLFTFDKELKFTKADDYYYVVVEKDLGAERMTYDKTVFGVKITVTDNGEGKLIASDPVYVAINGDTEKSASGIEFKNTYTPKSATYIIDGEKTLKGRAIKADEFEFELYDGEKSYEDGLIETVKNDKDGKFKFKELTFNQAKEYMYVVVEKNNEVERVAYDETVYGITIKVEADENGDFAVTDVTKIVVGEAGTVDGIKFENTYTPKPDDIKLNITAKKTVKNTGSEKIGPEGFEFVLENITKNEKTALKSDKDGLAVFGLTFTEDDIGKTYEYRLSETNDSKANVTYSTTVYSIEVTVSLSQENKLVADVTMDDKEVEDVVAEFENIYNYTPVPTPDSDKDPTPDPAPEIPESPKTGDSTNLMLWIAVFFVSGTGLFATVLLGKKGKKSEE